MNPSRIERVIGAGDLQKAGRLDKGRFAQTRNLLELIATAERTVLGPVLTESARRQLVHTRHVSQQRRTGRVDIHTHVVDARFDHRIKRIAQMLCLHIVLVHPHTDVGRIDLHQLGQWIEQTTSDGNRTPQHRVVAGQFLAAHRTGGIHTRPRFVHDDERDLILLQLVLHHIDYQLLGLATAGSIANGDDREVVAANEIDNLASSRTNPVLAANHMDDFVPEHVAEFVERNEFTATAKTGIDGQHAMIAYRRLQQQLAQIAGKHFHGVLFGGFCQLATQFALQPGDDQPLQRVADTTPQELGVRMPFGNQMALRFLPHHFRVGFHFHTEDPRTLATIDRQYAMRRNP